VEGGIALSIGKKNRTKLRIPAAAIKPAKVHWMVIDNTREAIPAPRLAIAKKPANLAARKCFSCKDKRLNAPQTKKNAKLIAARKIPGNVMRKGYLSWAQLYMKGFLHP